MRWGLRPRPPSPKPRPRNDADQVARLPYRPCVGVMLVNRGGQVWVGQRRDNHQDAWQMPQGGIDDGEAVVPAALRELWEETGITADLVLVVAQNRRTHPL